MSRPRILLAIVMAAAVFSACEPQNVAVAPTSAPATPAPTAAGSQAAGASASAAGSAGGSQAAHSPGVATVTTTATGAQVGGHGPVLRTPTFALPGPITMKLSTCGANGTFPFVWLYTEFNSTIGQYVEEVTQIPQVKAGNYYLHVVTPPDCEWTITFTSP